MNSKVLTSYKKTKREVFNKQLGVVFNGEDNLYPLLVEWLIKNSPTTSQCAWLYETFLNGSGFTVDFPIDGDVNLLTVRTPETLLSEVCPETAKHQEVYIHINYNALYQKVEFQVMPNNLCRVGQQDSKKYSGRIVVHPDGWDKRVDKKKIQVFDTYNPIPEVIQAQVDRDGGWNKYKGQILHFKFDDNKTYADSLVESCHLYSDMEASMGLFYNSTVKRGFENIQWIRHNKFVSAQKQKAFEDNLMSVMGIDNASSVILVEDDITTEKPEGNFKHDTLKNETKPEKYAHFEETAANQIRKSFKSVPPQLVDYVKGKLGNTSGEDLRVAESIYNKNTAKDRAKLTLLFRELYRNFETDINPTGDWEIGMYSFLGDGTIQEE